MIITCFPTGIVNIKHPGQGIMDLSGAGFTNVVVDMNLCGQAAELEDPSELSACIENYGEIFS